MGGRLPNDRQQFLNRRIVELCRIELYDRYGIKLTARETEILALVSKALTNSKIADELFITKGTVKQHLNHIISKLSNAMSTGLTGESNDKTIVRRMRIAKLYEAVEKDLLMSHQELDSGALLAERFPQLADINAIESIEIYPATENDIDWITVNERKVYDNPIDVMPRNLIQSWYRKNPDCFWMIKGFGGEIIGNIYIFPLKPSPLRKLINGEILEREIVAGDLYSRQQSDQITVLHICSFVCPSSSEGVVKCIVSTLKILQNFCDPRQIEYIYALGASNSGVNLLKKNGFSIICDARNRRDKHPYYSIRFVDLLTRIFHRLSYDERREFGLTF